MQLCLPHLGGNLSAIYLAVFPSDLSLLPPLSYPSPGIHSSFRRRYQHETHFRTKLPSAITKLPTAVVTKLSLGCRMVGRSRFTASIVRLETTEQARHQWRHRPSFRQTDRKPSCMLGEVGDTKASTDGRLLVSLRVVGGWLIRVQRFCIGE